MQPLCLRKSAPGPPNSYEHVFCAAPATRNASLQILFKCPRPAIVFGNATKTCFFSSLLTKCTIPCACHAKRTSKSVPKCTFSTSQLPKVVRTWCVLYILTSKSASRHNGVHFLDIATSKSGQNLVCFVHFDFDMCFAPQPRALFRHRNFQKWSEPGVFCTF